jgi:hypothetical protein
VYGAVTDREGRFRWSRRSVRNDAAADDLRTVTDANGDPAGGTRMLVLTPDGAEAS